MRRASPGQPLNIPAADWNLIVEMARAFSAQRGGTRGGPLAGLAVSPSTIAVLNDTAGTIEQFSVMSPREPIWQPADHEGQFRNFAGLRVAIPTNTDTGRLCVTTQPIRPGAIGTAVFDGVTVCRVEMRNPEHKAADVIAGDSGKLGSGLIGMAAILWTQPEEEWADDVAWGFVRLGAGIANPGYVAVKVVVDGGSPGDEATPCTLTYKLFPETAEEFDEDTILHHPIDDTPAEEVTPIVLRSNIGGYTEPPDGSPGLARINPVTGMWELWQAAEEVPYGEACS